MFNWIGRMFRMLRIIWCVSVVWSVSAGLVDADDSESFDRRRWLKLNVHRLRLVDTMWPNCGVNFQIKINSWTMRKVELTCRRPLPSNVLRIDSSVVHVLGKTLQSNRCRCQEFCPKFEPNLNEKERDRDWDLRYQPSFPFDESIQICF